MGFLDTIINEEEPEVIEKKKQRSSISLGRGVAAGSVISGVSYVVDAIEAED